MNKFWNRFQVNRNFNNNLVDEYDLQIHSFFSDGKESPEDLLFQASVKGLKGISITDHNSLWGYSESLFNKSKKLGIVLVPGVEIEVATDVDILVYSSDLGFNYKAFRDDINSIVKNDNQKRLKSASDTLQAIKDFLLNKMVKPEWLLWDKKTMLEKDEILERLTTENAKRINLKSGEIEKESRREYVGKPHIAAILGKYNLVDWVTFAQTYNVIDKSKLLKRSYEVLFNEIVKWPHIELDEFVNKKISSLTHLKILAHPGKTFKDMGFEFSEDKFKEFVVEYINKYNLDGAECFYGNYEEESADINSLTFQTLKYISKKSGKKMYGTRGTDSHGSLK